VPFEIRVFRCERLHFVHIRRIAPAARPVPEVQWFGLPLCQELMDHGAQGRHPGAATDEYFLARSRLQCEIAEGAAEANFVAHLQGVHVA